MDESSKKWDIKQLGIGGGSVLGILLLFQSQGIELMNRNQDTSNQIVIEKTIANANRITQLEQSVKDLNSKIDDGFNGVRDQLSKQVDRLENTINNQAKDIYTRSDHYKYADQIQNRIDRITSEIDTLRKEIRDIDKK